ncbi:MAG: hypothetical protein ABI835_06280 [Chloroflexota bacterium]
MKHRLVLPGLLALVLLFAACAPPPPLRDDTLLQDSSLITENTECSAPCWRGITPGVTAWSDALTILEDDTTLENVTVQDDDKSDAKVAEFQQQGGSACCQMFTEDGEQVNVIFLRVAPTSTVGELIAVQGEPTYLIGSQYSDDQAVVNLIYPEKSLVIYAFVPGTSGSITESSEVVGVLYMTPPDMDLLIKTNSLHAWEGYQAYLDYENGEFEVTPSVTLTPTPTGE